MLSSASRPPLSEIQAFGSSSFQAKLKVPFSRHPVQHVRLTRSFVDSDNFTYDYFELW